MNLDQWAALSLTTGAATCALALAMAAARAVRRRWPVLRFSRRPSLKLPERRPRYDISGEYAIIEHLAPGVGSLTSVREESPALERVELVDAQTRAEFAEVFDRVDRDFRVAIEPAMRKARLWELRGAPGRGAAPSAHVDLDHWRMLEDTGEFSRFPPWSLL